MRKACLFLAAMLMVMPTMVLAEGTEQIIGVSVSVESSGVSLPTPKTILECPGDLAEDADPWTQGCAAAPGISFSDLQTKLADGVTDADCFYAPKYFIVYLYPDAWGGVGYQIDQNFVWTTDGIPPESLVFTAVYSPNDKYLGYGPQGNKPGDALLGTSGTGGREQAVGTHRVYYSGSGGKPVIVRAQYGIPPLVSDSEDDIYPGWKKLPKSTPVGTYSGTLTITISPT